MNQYKNFFRGIKFNYLSMKNFLSYGADPVIIELDKPGTTLILGEDLDNIAQGVGANGVGKAQPLDCLVKVPGGWKRMGDIKLFDRVSTPDGKSAVVKGVFPQGKRDTYRITFSDGRQTEASDEHLWSVFSHRWGNQHQRGTKTLTTKELKQYVDTSNEKAKPWYNVFVPLCDPEETTGTQLPLDPYLLGALLGDGCLSTPQPRFSTIDEHIRDKVAALVERHHGILKHDTGCDYHINQAKDIKHLLGPLIGTKSNTKFIPDEYKERTSRQQKLSLLQGLLDTDGTVSSNGNISFCSVSETLAQDVQYLIRSIGGKARISKRRPSYKNDAGEKIQGQIAYNVSIQYHTPTELFTVPSKLLKTSTTTQYSNAGLRICSIERIESKDCQCILIDHPDHLYITDNFIVTHNTVLINALTYGVYDKPISNISKDNLVNNINKKHMEVVVEFEKNHHTYRIRRVRKAKATAAGNFVELFEDGIDITLDSMASTNKHIEHIIGMPYELFVRIVVFSATNTSFLDLPVRSQNGPNQTDIIEELFDLKTLSEKSTILKEQMRVVEATLKSKKQRIELLEKEHERHEKQLEHAVERVERWNTTNQAEIIKIQRQLDRVSKVDIEQQHSLHDNAKVVKEEAKQAAQTLVLLRKDKNAATTDLKKAKKELSHLDEDKCPYCLQEYNDSKAKIEQTKTSINELEKRLLSLNDEESQLDTQLVQLDEKLEELQKQLTVPDIEELVEIKNKSEEFGRKITELENTVNPYLEPLEELEELELDPINYDDVNTLTTKVDHMKFLYKLLTNKNSYVRKVLLNKSLPFLNQRLQEYLTKLGMSHQVEFTHEMTASITQFGRVLDFGNLSNGQRARVNLALSFAFRDVLQSLHDRVNICMFDEILDIGLDGPGVTAAARMLKRKARDENLSLYIISHRDEIDSAFDRTMTVQLTNGFSQIVER